MKQAQHKSEFSAQGISFAYSKLYKSFFCDTKTILYILQKHYPAIYEGTVKKYPELKDVVAEARKSKKKEQKIETVLLDKLWANKDQNIEQSPKTEPATHPEDVKEAPKPPEIQPSSQPASKPGLISKISRGIKKIVAKVTPKKLRKRWHLDDDEEVDKSKQSN